MYPLSFVKMQGVGNDFVVIDGRHQTDTAWSALAPTLCDRHIGVGADGLLVLDHSPHADFMMRMYNPDGSPDVCGNGLRCMARYARERAIVASDQMRVETLVDVRTADILRDATGNIRAVQVAMGQPRFSPADIPMQVDLPRVLDFPLLLSSQPSAQESLLPANTLLPVTVLSTGSTHAVTFVPTLPDDTTFHTLSPLVEHHPLFPERTSLMWCLPENATRFHLRIWERGAGETWGCGTGACATAVAAILHGYAPAGEPLTIASKGGELLVTWNPDATNPEILMTGPAEFVYEGRFRFPIL